MIKKYYENSFGKEFDSKPVYNDKSIKAKINLYNKSFYGNKRPIEGEHYTWFSVIRLDSIIGNYS